MKCYEKAKFKSRAKARKYQSIHNQHADGIKMHVYKCQICKHYHLSKFRKEVKFNPECNKTNFKELKDAEVARTQAKHQGKKYLRIYKCKECNYYHISAPRNETRNNKNTGIKESAVQPAQDK